MLWFSDIETSLILDVLIFVIKAKVIIEINKAVLILKNGIKFSVFKNNDEIEINTENIINTEYPKYLLILCSDFSLLTNIIALHIIDDVRIHNINITGVL